MTSTEEVVARLEAEVMPALAAKYGLTYTYKGRDEERRESFRDLKQGALLAICLIYITLAWVFASYWKPFTVISGLRSTSSTERLSMLSDTRRKPCWVTSCRTAT